MTQTKPVTMAIPGDPEDIALRDVPAAINERNHDILELSRQLTVKEKEASQLHSRIEFLDERIGIRQREAAALESENARLLKLAVWAAKEVGEHCPDCEDAALGEYYISGDCVGKPDSDDARSAIEEDLLEWASGTCTRAECVGGWVAFVPVGETIERGSESYTEPKRGDA